MGLKGACPHTRQTASSSNSHQAMVTCLHCDTRLLIVHRRVDRVIARRAFQNVEAELPFVYDPAVGGELLEDSGTPNGIFAVHPTRPLATRPLAQAELIRPFAEAEEEEFEMIDVPLPVATTNLAGDDAKRT